MILDGKTVLVCGAGPGLGGEIARGAVREGANVVLVARTRAKLEALASELGGGARVALVTGDVKNAEDCARMAETAVSRFGGLDALALVAAVDNTAGGVMAADLEVWRNALEVNVIGAAHVIRAAVPAMRSGGGGSIVLIGSQATFLPQMPQIGYASSKGAMITAMYYMARELGPDRIRVNTVIPTWMWGPPVERYVEGEAARRGVPESEVVAQITRNMPLGEIPRDDDVAEAVLFFASDRARMITGQMLMVNAGELMR
ncbi:MAG: SDR family oxidoreductase [Deltaproteobacteria bacterium]|nr:SDR family oxidoreductase [Deltaproteobacteria bacterium]